MRVHRFGSHRTSGCQGDAASPWRQGLSGMLLAFVVSSLFVSSVQAQQNGRIVGRVTAAESGAPIGEAQVFIAGTGLGSLSRSNGAFVILEVPAGTHTLRVERI